DAAYHLAASSQSVRHSVRRAIHRRHQLRSFNRPQHTKFLTRPFGVTPMFRFIKSSGQIRPFIEAGGGVRLLTHPTISDNFSLSTAFQFAPTGGVGVQFGQRQQYQVGYRFEHVSNAGIKEPNPGINFHQFYLQYNF
ncbi:acyloxyacyl hydrolase, partial [Burkholderia cenocepacia]|uniref:acyloxyacyl hydrolase n=1 Tax=Burkholderia cenocepacia TaxID=95486 RepID=UPI00265175D4